MLLSIDITKFEVWWKNLAFFRFRIILNCRHVSHITLWSVQLVVLFVNGVRWRFFSWPIYHYYEFLIRHLHRFQNWFIPFVMHYICLCCCQVTLVCTYLFYHTFFFYVFSSRSSNHSYYYYYCFVSPWQWQ